MTHYVNPDLEAFQAKTKITVTADPTQCNFHIFVGPWSKFTECDRAKDALTKSGLSFTSVNGPAGSPVVIGINDKKLEGFDAKEGAAKLAAALKEAGFVVGADRDKSKVNWFMAEVILVIMLVYVTMVYGPIAAFLVEMFPTNIRYTSMSLPYHIGNGWFGGMLPLLATALVAWSGDIYFGLWYPIGIAVMTLVIGTIFLRETKDVDITKDVDLTQDHVHCRLEPAAPQGPPVSFWRIVIPSEARDLGAMTIFRTRS